MKLKRDPLNLSTQHNSLQSCSISCLDRQHITVLIRHLAVCYFVCSSAF